jgi:hypothetical protein
MNNPEKMAAWCTTDEEKQKHNTICVGHQLWTNKHKYCK